MYGDTTSKFISYLKKNGPQTVKQLEMQPFWGGVRSRIGKLVEQGRIIRVEVVNPFPGRAVAMAYKATDEAECGPLPRGRRTERETYRERVRREKKERAIARAIALLEKQGYTVLTPNAELRRAADKL